MAGLRWPRAWPITVRQRRKIELPPFWSGSNCSTGTDQLRSDSMARLCAGIFRNKKNYRVEMRCHLIRIIEKERGGWWWMREKTARINSWQHTHCVELGKRVGASRTRHLSHLLATLTIDCFGSFLRECL